MQLSMLVYERLKEQSTPARVSLQTSAYPNSVISSAHPATNDGDELLDAVMLCELVLLAVTVADTDGEGVSDGEEDLVRDIVGVRVTLSDTEDVTEMELVLLAVIDTDCEKEGD